METEMQFHLTNFISLICIIIVTQMMTACACDPLTLGHIAANVPDTANFKAFLIRDLNSYFSSSLQKPVKVEYELLRNGPTQTGIAYPKYYAWVRIYEGSTMLEEGAVRLAAMNRTAFDVTHF